MKIQPCKIWKENNWDFHFGLFFLCNQIVCIILLPNEADNQQKGHCKKCVFLQVAPAWHIMALFLPNQPLTNQSFLHKI